MFTNMSPFKLNVLLAKNKIMLAARGGDISSIDIVVPEKNTGIAPGPMLTEFKEAGIPTKIDQGTIWISKETTPVKKGGVINEKLAPLLGKLDIKPVEAGISLYSAIEEGLPLLRLPHLRLLCAGQFTETRSNSPRSLMLSVTRTRIRLRTPHPFELKTALFGHGWIALAPHRWDDATHTWHTALTIPAASRRRV